MKPLSLVIPAYGAGDLLRGIISHVPALRDTAERCGFRLLETIVVDDGDSMPVDAGAFPAVDGVDMVVLRNGRNMGKGYSVRKGALAARGDWVLMSDADESAPLTEFAKLAPFADRALVCGSRYGGDDARPFHRRMLSWLFNRLTGTGLKDSQCGFKLFNMPLMRAAFYRQRTERFAFDVELIRSAPSVVEVPVEWRGGRRSTLRVWRDAPRMLLDLLRIRCCSARSGDLSGIVNP